MCYRQFGMEVWKIRGVDRKSERGVVVMQVGMESSIEWVDRDWSMSPCQFSPFCSHGNNQTVCGVRLSVSWQHLIGCELSQESANWFSTDACGSYYRLHSLCQSLLSLPLSVFLCISLFHLLSLSLFISQITLSLFLSFFFFFSLFFYLRFSFFCFLFFL